MVRSVYVSAGHSDADPGATTVQTVDGVKVLRKEEEIATEMRNMVAFYLAREGIPHALDGAGTVNLPLKNAAADARQYDIAVEFHCNAAASPQATGVETLQDQSDTRLGSLICEAIARTLRIRNRGAKPENAGHHSRLAFVRAGGIIVELFFISNPNDLAAWDARKWLAASAVADVLVKAARQA